MLAMQRAPSALAGRRSEAIKKSAMRIPRIATTAITSNKLNPNSRFREYLSGILNLILYYQFVEDPVEYTEVLTPLNWKLFVNPCAPP